MFRIKKSLFALVLWFLLLSPQAGMADEADVLIPTVNPDVLLILDLSFSMACDINLNNCTDTSGTHSWSRLYMAKQAIKSILDYNRDGSIDANDETGLGVRIGYMSFVTCSSDDTGGDWNSACNAVRVRLPAPDDPPPFASSSYSDVWTAVNNASTNSNSGTAIVAALSEAALYLTDTKNGNSGKGVSADPYKDCRQKFAILVTDGRETCSCGGGCFDNNSYAWKNRNMVAKAAALKAAGYKVFVIGFGQGLTASDKNTLNWAAYYGGTDNPGDTKSPLIDQTHPPAITVDSNPCRTGADNDPGNSSLTGYAFTATNTDSLQNALLTAFDAIKNSIYSFSITSVSSSRTAADNLAYGASFQPRGDPFWPGFLRESSINGDGSLTPGWEAGSILSGNSSRNIQTYTGGSLTDFHGTSWGTWKDLLGTDTDGAKMIIPYIRGDATPDNWKLGDVFHSNPITIGKPNPYFEDPRDTNKAYDGYRNDSAIKNRAKIILVGANDGQLHAFDGNAGNEVWSFIPPNFLPKLKYLAHSGHPTILTHQFYVDGPISAADIWTVTGTGRAKNNNEWKTYLVFGEGKGVRDNTNTPGHTSYLWSSSQSCDQNFNVPPHGTPYVWTSTYKYYCGYHTLDVTATGSTPAYKWIINSNAATKAISDSHGPYLGEPWSKMAIGKVLIGGNETWVGFIGGGYGQSGSAGKGFFVIDLKDGHILWSHTAGDSGFSSMSYIPASPLIVDTDVDGFIDTAYVGDLSGNMWRFTFCTKMDGDSCATGSWSGGLFFQPSTTRPIYTAATFARDWQSNQWVFWGTGDKMSPNSTGSGNAGKFYAVKDNSRSGSHGESDLQDLTNATEFTGTTGWYVTLGSGGEKMLADPTVFGGIVLFSTYLPYAGTNPCVSAGKAYLYAMAMQDVRVPGSTYKTGAGLLMDSAGNAARSIFLGSGIASAPTISQSSPGAVTSFFVSVSGGVGAGGGGAGGDTAATTPTVTRTKLDFDANSGLIKELGQTGLSTQILHWRDGRIQ